jgi:hypothetical protein
MERSTMSCWLQECRALVVDQDWLNGEIDQNARVSEASESVG